MLKAIMVTASLMLAVVQARAATPPNERFLHSEAQGSTYELAIAQLAQTRAIRPEVRAYAGTLVNDHEAYNDALRDLARSKGVALPSSMTAKSQLQLNRLAAAPGAAFDDAFIREAQRINAADGRGLRREASRTSDPDIRSFVGRFLEVEKKHEAGARALSKHTVASRMPVMPPPSMSSNMQVITPPRGGQMPVIPPPAQP